jgi:hypothetical protein
VSQRKRLKAVDLADELAAFVRAYPQWTVPPWAFWRRDRGMPVSWQHFSIGQRHLGLAYNREMLRTADAVAVGTSPPECRSKWAVDIEPFAGM